MPQIRESIEVKAKPGRVWTYTQVIENWASLMPGFISFAETGSDEYLWLLRGKVGLLSRQISLSVKVRESVLNQSVTFSLEGQGEPVTGEGALLMDECEAGTQVTFQLRLDWGGVTGPMMNAILKRQLPQMISLFAPALAVAIDSTMAETGNDFKMERAPYKTERRIAQEGLSDAFYVEAIERVQQKIFGEMPLFGPGALGSHESPATIWCFGVIFGRGGLDLRLRSLLVLAGLVVLPRPDLVRVWINAALNLGWSEEEIRELIIFTCYFGGFPAMRNAGFLAHEIFEKRRNDPTLKMA